MPRSFIAMTYGDAAAIHAPPEDPLRIFKRLVSLYGMTMPTHSAEPMEKIAKRTHVTLKAALRHLLGSSTSSASIDRYSGPATVNVALQRQPRNPSKRLRSPVVIYSANAPGLFQYWNWRI
jgi:hypothetical protein